MIGKVFGISTRYNKMGQYKIAVALFIALCIQKSRSHVDPDDSSDLESDNVDEVPLSRREMSRQWQYEGIPIDVPEPGKSWNQLHAGRRKGDVQETTVSSTTTRTTTRMILPPMDRRYRRIYNADETTSVKEFPFMAAVLVNKRLWCGGIVIDTDRILTAAHCLQLQYNNRYFREYVKMLTVRVGSTNATAGGEVLRVTAIYFHPNYKPENLEFNLAVLRLHKNITLGSRSNRVEIIDYSRSKVPLDRNVTFLGWGSVFGLGTGGDVLLQKVDLPVYDLPDCQEIYGRDLVTRHNFCAGYITVKKNVCNHDAGGPAIMDGVLVGVLSFSSKRCDEADKPAVFSNVGSAAQWLDDLSKGKSKTHAESVLNTPA